MSTLVDGDGEVEFCDNFSTKACYDALVGPMEVCIYSKFLWKNDIPSKVSFMLWADLNNSLPTRDMLRHKSVEIDSSLCMMCNTVDESADHLFLHCQTTFKVWDHLIKAFHISWSIPGSILELFEASRNNVLTGRYKELWNIIHYALDWIIWDERNKRVFGGRN
ncbi:uncharacterized protein LOC113324369 [Papaver somniferum]|uniref:uncharacterized protein LOC113324369 n=1 Tax=Papaver somniferum TaxID=3469 RepID=UPI000E6F49F9|nr:uncharacterized protein LOC113324369 [Papaver somniferum]